MSGTISSPGIGSGINISSIVQQLVQADFGPQQTQIQNQQKSLKAELSAYGSINSDVSAIGSALSGLQNLSQGYAANSTNSGVLTASAQSGAGAGTYNVNVSSLASAQRLASTAVSSPSASLGTGTLTFQFGSYGSGGFTANSATSSTQITLNSANDTLQGLADAINKANFGVSATIVNNGSGYQLALTSKTGTDNQLNITSSSSALSGFTYNGGTGGMTQTTAASNAALTLNGIAVSSDSNTIKNAVKGVNFTLTGTGSTTVSVAPDTNSITSAVQSFVNAYNGYAKDVSKYANYDPKTKQAGVLLGSATLRSLTSELQNGVVQNIPGASSGYSTLMDLGITANSDGTLSLNTSKLSSAIQSNYPAVIAALTGAGKQLGAAVSTMTGTNGVISAKTDSINQQLTNLGKQLKTLNNEASQEQQTLLQQYNYMDTVVANLKNTSNYLSQMLSGSSAGSSSSGSSGSSGSSSSKIGG